MISFSKKTLNMDKLYLLLQERRDLIINNFLAYDDNRQNIEDFDLTYDDDSIVLSCQFIGKAQIYRILEVSDYKGLEFDSFGYLRLSCNRTTASLKIEDLLSFGILDESKIVYVATYEASEESYSTECRLLGVYNSFEELRLQFDKLASSTEDIEVHVVRLNALEDLYLNGYQE